MESAIEQICGKEAHSWFYQITDRFGFTRPAGRAIKQLNYLIAESERELEKAEDRSVQLDIEDRIDRYGISILNIQIQDDMVRAAQKVLGREADTLEKVTDYLKSPGKQRIKRTALRRMQHYFEKKYGHFRKGREAAREDAVNLCDVYKNTEDTIHLCEDEIVVLEEKIAESHRGYSNVQKELESTEKRESELDKSSLTEEAKREQRAAIAERKEECRQVLNAYEQYIEQVKAKQVAYRQERDKHLTYKDEMIDELLAKKRKMRFYDQWLCFYDTIKDFADKLDGVVTGVTQEPKTKAA